MPVTLRTATDTIQRMEPAYYDKGKAMHAIRRVGAVYRMSRFNHQKYGLKAKMADYATKALALTAAQNDYNNLRPVIPAATTTSAGFTQPAVGATVAAVTVTSATGLAVGQYVTIATGGKYEITAIAGNSLTLKNLLPAPDNAAPGTVIATAKAFTVVPGW
jgi:hypothetical protein